MTRPEEPEVRIQQDEFPPVLYMDQMDAAGRSGMLDLYNSLFTRVMENGEDSLSLEEFAQWRILSMAYRTGSVSVNVFRASVGAARKRIETPAAERAGEAARGVRIATAEQIRTACDAACLMFRNPAPTLDAEALDRLNREATAQRIAEQGEGTGGDASASAD